MVYNTSGGIVAGKLNVHLVPHTHDDVGWLKTVDQYYVGSNNSIQGACVQNVLDSLIPALLADKNRKFIYVEQAFFQRWWRNQSKDMKKTVEVLVNSGQLEFINGGMCMHDEAATHYIDMIDQTTLGHRFIKDEFNVVPRIGWQIDPFGHSAVQAYLLGAEVGFDALFFARIDYQDRAKRRDEKKLEVIWQGSKSRGSSSQIFTGAFYAGNYEPPTGFYFEVNDDSPIVQDDKNLFDYNVEERVDAFVAAALSQANVTRSNHVMWTMGTDFKYQYAETWFRNMDKLIHYVNQDGRVNVLYSTPSIYTDAKHALNEPWPLKTEDYFPPAIKGYVRMMSGYYLAARQLELFRGRNKSGPTTDSLADALAIAQHHDAVTGTEKQHVADDYAKRLSIGYKESEDVVAASLDCLTQRECKSSITKFNQCPLLNISYCPATEVDLSNGKKIVISENVIVKDSTGKVILSQLIPIVNASIANRKFYATAYMGESFSANPTYWLAFTAVVPPLGFSTYVISSGKPSALIKPISYTFDGSRNEQLYSYYAGDDGSTDLVNYQASGAYVFRPNGTYAIQPEGKIPLTVLNGPLYDEVHRMISPWIYQITRVYKEKEHAEVEFIVGPIPVGDKVGKEIVTQIKTSIGNHGTFYTDSNGRDFLERINLGIYIKDKNTELSVLVDRSVGGASIADGEIEIMLHRRLLHDDGRGVDEALNETVCILNTCSGLTVQGKYYLRFDPLGEGSKWRRSFGQEIYSPFLLAFTEQDGKWTNFAVPTFSAMDPTYSLPDNVAIITLQELEDRTVLLRLAHLYEVGEDKDLSVMATVELKRVFPKTKINRIKEMSLSANQERQEMEKKRLSWKVEGSNMKRDTDSRGGPVDPINLVGQLKVFDVLIMDALLVKRVARFKLIKHIRLVL
ncbi:alpha-mannosidase [Phtheirospermum japonicum]|uniref:Alpha-mannosidase n=1 Tax=Phtheirospermum japonicum TaxID=374723 RepID=A0A830BTU1_9LAMI|nr:alpha-mannosidase [Phtheirospermum japonicum]